MSTGGVIAIVVGALVVVFLAVNRGLVHAGVQVPVGVGGQKGIVAPQPAQNYGGYLAATTAPQVSNILSTVISGANSALRSWLTPAPSAQTPPRVGASASSPSLSAQPSGPAVTYYQPTIGPVVSPDLSYNSTSQAAFDYSGLSFDNGFDPNASLDGVFSV